MRLLCFYLLLGFSFGCTTSKKTSTIPTGLNGTWIPVMQELGGTTMPPTYYNKQKLIIKDSSYTLVAEQADKGIVKYAGGKMDIYGSDGPNSGKHFTAIYKMENERLMICYNLSGDGYPESFSTKQKPAYFLCIFKQGGD